MNVKTPISEVFHGDCMEYMAGKPDGYFDLLIADPPYGIGESGSTNHTRSKMAKSKNYKAFSGRDKEAMPIVFFDELRRVSKNQIVWGANHFISRLPYDSPAWIIWDKQNGETDFADCELAWTSFKCSARKFEFRWQGMLQGNMANKEKRIHPTQKPVALYKWLLTNYAKPGQKIFDPMMGSQSSRIAAWDMGFDFYGCEMDSDYFRQGCERFEKHIAKPMLFAPEQMYQFEQQKLFEE